ncbi:uncharacterized protein TNCV_4837961 [Trichonephila clavipes]|nr:uncharacterized protein TNCV_4837961 [Trichonephila clavipes]
MLTPSYTKTKSVLPLAQIPPQTMTDFGYWQCSIGACRGAWSVRTPDSIFWGVMILLSRKELLTSKKESFLTLTCGPSQKFSGSSEPHECFFFSVKAELFATCKASVQAPFLLFTSPICHLFPCHERSVSWKPPVSLDSFFDGSMIP